MTGRKVIESFQDYLNSPAINASQIKPAVESPRHWAVQAPRADKEAFKIGSAIHCLVLEGEEKFNELYPVFVKPLPDKTMAAKENKEAYARFQMQNVGKTIITNDDLELVMRVEQSVKAKPQVLAMLEGQDQEFSIYWDEELYDSSAESPETAMLKIPCKARIDHFHDNKHILVDLKTARSASPDDFIRDFLNFGYHIQLAHYRKALASIGHENVGISIIVLEKEPPYDVVVYSVDEPLMEAGDFERNRGVFNILKAQKALASNEWVPGVDAKEGYLNLTMPAWYKVRI